MVGKQNPNASRRPARRGRGIDKTIMTTTELTTNQLHILRHSLGLDQNGHGREYRNYYCTGPDCDGYKELVTLAEIGLVELGRIDGNNHFYFLTEAGKTEARKGVVYPKLTRSQKRYQDFRDADGGMKFKEWLKAWEWRRRNKGASY